MTTIVSIVLVALIAECVEWVSRSLVFKRSRREVSLLRNILRRRSGDSLNSFSYEYAFVIPAFNNDEETFDTVSDLMGKGVPKDQIIVVDDFSRDKLERTKNSGVHFLRVAKDEKDIPKMRALKKGAEFAKEILRKKFAIFLDSDSKIVNYDIDCLHSAMREMEILSLDGMAGRVVPYFNNDNILTRLQYLEYLHSMRVGRGSLYRLGVESGSLDSDEERKSPKFYAKSCSQLCVSGAFGIFRIDRALEILRQMNSKVMGEDCEFTYRFMKAGYDVGYCDDIVIGTIPPEKISEWIKQRIRWFKFQTCYLFENFFPDKYSKKRRDGNVFKFNLSLQYLRDFIIHPLKAAFMIILLFMFPVAIPVFYLVYFVSEIVSYMNIRDEEDEFDFMSHLLYPIYKSFQVVYPMTISYIQQFRRYFEDE